MDDSQAVDATHVPVPAGPRDPEARLALIESQMVELRRENEALRAVLAQLEAKAESMGTPIASGAAEGNAGANPDEEPLRAEAPDRPATWSRRTLLLGGVGAAAGALHVTATATPATAAAGDALLLGRNNSSGATGTNVTSTSASYTFQASSAVADAAALKGTNDNGLGVIGASVEGTGVAGSSDRGYGVIGGSRTGAGCYGFSFSGTGAAFVSSSGPAVSLLAGNVGSLPSARNWSAGDIVATSNAHYWLCVQSGNPGKWRLLGSPNSAGAYVPLTPTRVYDSRLPQPDAGRVLQAGTERTFGIGQSRDITTGAVTGQLLPAGTRGVAVNVTITGTTGSGFLALTPGVAGNFSASAINWSAPSQTIANGLNLTADALLQLKAWVRGGNTHLIVDVMGYFSQI